MSNMQEPMWDFDRDEYEKSSMKMIQVNVEGESSENSFQRSPS